MNDRIRDFLRNRHEDGPILVVDKEIVRDNYLAFARALPDTRVFYAVKANPDAQILELLTQLGSCFDCASIGEIEMVLAAGATADRISFGNTIKKEKDAEWPLSRKFGCEVEMAPQVLEHAHRLGLKPYGVSFHVGSQQRNPGVWDGALESASWIFREMAERGITLSMVNLGGGFPTKYLKEIPGVESYGSAIFRSLRKHFGNNIPETIIEPGRGMVGNAGVIEAEVVLISKKSDRADDIRWVYLDIGKFHGLAETMDEAIRYPIRTRHDGAEKVPCVLAGPTCDSVDVMYEKEPYWLPFSLEIGDKVLIEGTGAYTTTYSSRDFNGMPGLTQVVI
jgi:ornithine decarboxylase